MPARMTTEEFVAKAREVHGDRYYYSAASYTGAVDKLAIGCHEHGLFSQVAYAHLRGQGCPSCAAVEKWLTQEDFVSKAKEKHGGKYDYSKSIYRGAKLPVEIVCKEHGLFIQIASDHLNGRGCRDCGRLSATEKIKTASGLRTTTEAFVKDAIAKHGNRYDYSLSNYSTDGKKVAIVCHEHGEFRQTPKDHLRGQGCPKCGRIAAAKNTTKTTEWWVAKAKSIWEGAYDYSMVDYKGRDTKVTIVCRTHGAFTLLPDSHVGKLLGCPKCSLEKRKDSAAEFIAKAELAHSGKYSYLGLAYAGSHEPVAITCPVHGSFYAIAYQHIQGRGCPKCRISNRSMAELDIARYIESVYTGEVRCNDRSIVPPMEVDVLIPELRLGVEYCGLYWHRTTDAFKSSFHTIKLDAVASAGHRLITIFEDEWLSRRGAVELALKRVLLPASLLPLGARKCSVEVITSERSSKFLEEFHLSGSTGAQVHLGLYSSGGLVSVATFSKVRSFYGGHSGEGDYELVRFCQRGGTVVHGGLGKLCSAFFSMEPAADRLISYVDRRWFTGASYLKNGFSQVAITAPNYWYFKQQKRYSRFSFAKHRLEKKLESYDPALTEVENMEANGYFRIHDCGNLKMQRLR